MKTRSIIAVLTAALLGAGTLVWWGAGQSIRLDPVTLPAAGVSQSTDELPVQFEAGDLLYRAWDDSARLRSAAEDETTLAGAALVRFADGDLMLTRSAVAVDPAGTARDLAPRVLVEQQADGSYLTEGTAVSALDVVRLAQRRYYLPAAATVVVDGVEVATTAQTQIAIDRTGSATLTGADNVRHRYLGHMQLVVDAEHVVDVSAEMYFAAGQEIDLTKFGGTDNEMLVLADGSTATGSATDEPDEASTDAGAGTTQDAADASGSGSGTGSGTGAGTGGGLSLEEMRRLEEIAAAIEAINAQNAVAIPTVAFAQVTPGATSVALNVQVADPSAALVGGVDVRVVDVTTGEVVAGRSVDAGTTAVDLGPLRPGGDYALGYAYTYDFGAGDGPQRVEVAEGLELQTLTVTALYTVTDLRATSARVHVALDSRVADIASARLTVDAVGGFLGIGSGRVQEVELSASDLAGSGASVVLRDLSEQTAYRVGVTLTLTDGSVVELNESGQIITSAATVLAVTSFTATGAGTLAVAYDWASEQDTLIDVEVRLTRTGLFGSAVGSAVVADGSGLIEVVPDVDAQSVDLTGALVLTVTDPAGGTRELRTSIGTATWTQGWTLRTVGSALEGYALEIGGPAGALGSVDAVRFEQAPLTATDPVAWQPVAEAPLVAADDGTVVARWDVPADQVPFLGTTTSRAVLLRDGTDLLTVTPTVTATERNS